MKTIDQLTADQASSFHDAGYVIGLPPVFSAGEVTELNAGLDQLRKLLAPGEDLYKINGWHQTSKWLYDVCTHPQIVAYVQGLLGEDFYLWAVTFSQSRPHSSGTVAWHQDAYYWPLSPHHTVTVWLAFTDVDEENGAMQVIPRSHKAGMIKHRTASSDTSVLGLELEHGTFSVDDAVSLNLKAGCMSLHDDALIHGSPANNSDRWRTGLTMRFSQTDVKCDLKVWPGFTTYVVHGEDKLNLNPRGRMPTEMFAR